MTNIIWLFLDVKLKLEAATTLRDSLDHYTSGQIYTPFLKKLMPIFINTLRGQCIFQSNSLEQVRTLPRSLRGSIERKRPVLT
jgi:hypothetical protein